MTTGTEASIVSSTSNIPLNLHTHTRSVTGFKKALRGKPCEDAIKVVKAKNGVVCAVADGHGDARCKYADIGARLAVETACEALKAVLCGSLTSQSLYKQLTENFEDIEKDIIKRWNTKVFKDFLAKPEGSDYTKIGPDIFAYILELFDGPNRKMTIEETRKYYGKRDEYEELLHKITFFYGTTLNVVLVTDKYIFCIGLGDGDIIAVQGKRLHWLFPPSEQFSTRTESLCWKPSKALSAFRSIVITKSKSKNSKSYMESNINPDFIMVSTDGLRNSFLDDEDYVEKMLALNSEAKSGYVKFQRNSKRWIERLTKESVCKDDITFGFIY